MLGLDPQDLLDTPFAVFARADFHRCLATSGIIAVGVHKSVIAGCQSPADQARR
jgi:hypothetical protein